MPIQDFAVPLVSSFLFVLSAGGVGHRTPYSHFRHPVFMLPSPFKERIKPAAFNAASIIGPGETASVPVGDKTPISKLGLTGNNVLRLQHLERAPQ
jgi:hypothetical protein